MRNSIKQHYRKLVAISSEHSVTLAWHFPPAERAGLLGLAIRRHNPDGTIVWLEGGLGFQGYPHMPGEPLTSNVAPFQKMYWADYTVREGVSYTYEVIPVYGTPPAGLQLDQTKALALAVTTESGTSPGAVAHNLQFNRAVVSSQAYSRNFGLVAPSSDPRILQWLARGLDLAILGFIAEAENHPQTSLEVAAYHLDHPDIIAALARVGSRVTVVLDPDPNSNLEAKLALGLAGVNLSFRETVPNISHNKFIVLHGNSGPEAVLIGSTNFTVSGVSEQNNVCHVIRNAALANIYSQYFALLKADKNADLRQFNKVWRQPDPLLDLRVNFSPHAQNERVDLDEYVNLVQQAKDSLLFAMFMGTDAALISALTQPTPAQKVVVRGLVNDVTQGATATAGQVMLYHEAYDPNPAVVAARPLAGGIEPFLEERGRVWTGNYFVPMVHHKFMVLGFPGPNALVVTGSANYSKNSTEKNDENTLIIGKDPRIVDMYVGELFRIYEHYRARWFIERNKTNKPSELYLKSDNSWIAKYYQPAKESARFLKLLLSAG